MKIKLIAGCGFILICFGALLYFKVVEFGTFPKHPVSSDQKKVPNDWLFRQRAYPFGKIDTKAYLSASQAKIEYAEQQSNSRNGQNDAWTFCGPMNISGRVTDIEMTLEQPYLIYAGSASGGIFKSEDLGVSWLPIFDQQPCLAIGDLAIAKSNNNIIYVGTGEANGGGGSIAYEGNGVYKSIDAGDSWIHLGLEDIGSAGKVIIHPQDPDICFVGAMGALFENDENRGLFRTKDGGDSWEKVLFINDSTGIVDLAINSNQPDTVFATAWERVRRVNRRSYGGPSSGIFRSYDGGDTWNELTNGLPTKSSRIGIAISESDPAILYAFYVDEDSYYIKGIFRSGNHGDSWTEVNSSDISEQPYMYWFGKIFVDPNDPDNVYLAGFYMEKSTDAGESWQRVFIGSHVDQHALYIHPENSNLVISGNDGGACLSMDGGESMEVLRGLPTIQFYTCEMDQSFPQRLYGGAQDNGTLRTFNGSQDNWNEIYYGDGFRVLVDPYDNKFVYAEYQYGNLARSTNGGYSFSPATFGINSGDRNGWNTPVVFHPNDPSILYYGSNRLYKSSDRAQFWQVISPDLTSNFSQDNLVYSTLSTISVSPLDDNIIFTGSDDGNVNVTTDGGLNWTSVSSSLPNRWVTSVEADPNDPDAAYVTFSGYRFGENIGHIYKTTNLGNQWQDISGNLPDIPINDFIKSPPHGTLYIATDIGVFHSKDDGLNWNLLGTQLPNVVITDLDYHPTENILIAASYGRGMFKIDLDDLNTGTTEVEKPVQLELQAYPNPFSERTIIKMTVYRKEIYLISLYDQSGLLIQKIHSGALETGAHEFTIDGVQLSSGLYFFNVVTSNQAQQKSIRIIKERI